MKVASNSFSMEKRHGKMTLDVRFLENDVFQPTVDVEKA